MTNSVVPAATAEALPGARGLKLLRVLPENAGVEGIASEIAAGEVDALVFLRDPLATPDSDTDPESLPWVADAHNIPVATNLAAAECLVRALTPEAILTARR